VRSGFVALVGRPNAGKSTLLNRIVGEKVSIVSDKPQTTRTRVTGVLHRPGAQVVFVDTPGLHKPVTELGARMNETASSTLDVDVVCVVLDATAPVGRGDRFVAQRLPADRIVVVTKIDLVGPEQLLRQLEAAAGLGGDEYFPVSGLTGEGLDALVGALVERLPEGPAWFPEDMVTDAPEAFRVAELVREELLARVHEELPHSIATRVTEWQWHYICCEILVERESQKGMVIGKGGRLVQEVGRAVRRQLPEGVYLDLRVKVMKDWQRRRALVDRLLEPGSGPE
jgi:GTPase